MSEIRYSSTVLTKIQEISNLNRLACFCFECHSHIFTVWVVGKRVLTKIRRKSIILFFLKNRLPTFIHLFLYLIYRIHIHT